MNHAIAMLLYAMLSGLSLYNLGIQIPRVWHAPEAAPDAPPAPFYAPLIRAGLVGWILFSTALVLVVCAKWMP